MLEDYRNLAVRLDRIFIAAQYDNDIEAFNRTCELISAVDSAIGTLEVEENA